MTVMGFLSWVFCIIAIFVLWPVFTNQKPRR